MRVRIARSAQASRSMPGIVVWRSGAVVGMVWRPPAASATVRMRAVRGPPPTLRSPRSPPASADGRADAAASAGQRRPSGAARRPRPRALRHVARRPPPRPPATLPALRLRETNDVYDLGENPQPLVRLIYSTPRLPEAAEIELWRARDLRRILRVPPYPYQCQRQVRRRRSRRARLDRRYLSARAPARGRSLSAPRRIHRGGRLLRRCRCHDRCERLLPLRVPSLRLDGGPARAAPCAAPASAADLMSRALAVIVVAVLAAVAPAAAAPPAPKQLTMRLTDLAPGYSLPFGPCEADPALADVTPLGNRNCVIEFGRAWTPLGAAPGPAVVISAAAVFRSAAGAQAALAHPREIAFRAFDPAPDDFEVVEPGPAIGDEAILLRAVDGSATVVWRSGSTLAALLAGNGLRRAPAVDVQTAVALASAQQARIAAPTPLRFADNDASHVESSTTRVSTCPSTGSGRSCRDAARCRRSGCCAASRRTRRPRGSASADRLYGRPHARADVILQLGRPSLLRRPAIRRELRRLRRDPLPHRPSVARRRSRDDLRARPTLPAPARRGHARRARRRQRRSGPARRRRLPLGRRLRELPRSGQPLRVRRRHRRLLRALVPRTPRATTTP